MIKNNDHELHYLLHTNLLHEFYAPIAGDVIVIVAKDAVSSNLISAAIVIYYSVLYNYAH